MICVGRIVVRVENDGKEVDKIQYHGRHLQSKCVRTMAAWRRGTSWGYIRRLQTLHHPTVGGSTPLQAYLFNHSSIADLCLPGGLPGDCTPRTALKLSGHGGERKSVEPDLVSDRWLCCLSTLLLTAIFRCKSLDSWRLPVSPVAAILRCKSLDSWRLPAKWPWTSAPAHWTKQANTIRLPCTVSTIYPPIHPN